MTAVDALPEGAPELLSVVYTSFGDHEFDEEQLGGLLRQSRRNNAESGITGMLLYRGGRFLQVLEGPRDAVRSLLATIGEDSRHRGMRVLFEEALTERHFAEWTMGHARVSEPAGEAPPGFRSTFHDLDDPTDLDSTMRAVRELSLWFRVRATAGA
ncbi:BLUF domain-containing protein [Marisediminicola sp. LYQ134]|uniref:BLUF domain-containing protein n=1 Tax=unclassified Marisediminicola TaxID=2618316 RepID=UPI003983A4C8